MDNSMTYEEWCKYWGLEDYDPYDPFEDYDDIPDTYEPDIDTGFLIG